ncbi:outer membrane protein [Lysobacter korlensis]|uniref:Outer membrane protein n=1 Tax=Lysobacter korlensis TaxID=553636 RepID=A0ABV6RIM6_9GAMM
MKAPLPRLIVLAAALAATPAFAQSGDDWTGGYVGAHAGVVMEPDDEGDRFLFDTNLDGAFGDTVRTVAGADAFSPGACDGVSRGPTPGEGCEGNNGGADWGVRAGYDWQAGTWVFGVVGELGMNDVRDALTAFSTTPASYTAVRKIDSLAALRARVGMAFGEGNENLVYATGGYAWAKVENAFFSSNRVNTFTDNGDSDASGAQFGLGYERRFNDVWTVGVEYVSTRLNDDEYRVRASGPAPATNPFILANAAGTDFRRSDEDFDLDSVRVTVGYRF